MGVGEVTTVAEKGGRRAAFLDRDGVIIELVDELIDSSQIKIFRAAPGAIRRLNELGYLCVVITNQPVVEKGLITLEKVGELNDDLWRRLGKMGARVDASYTCPHQYRPVPTCTCRKPDIGMITRAVRELNINLKKSWLIGDTRRDIETGRRAGVRTMLVETGDGGRDRQFFQTESDFTARDLRHAVEIIEREDGAKG